MGLLDRVWALCITEGTRNARVYQISNDQPCLTWVKSCTRYHPSTNSVLSDPGDGCGAIWICTKKRIPEAIICLNNLIEKLSSARREQSVVDVCGLWQVIWHSLIRVRYGVDRSSKVWSSTTSDVAHSQIFSYGDGRRRRKKWSETECIAFHFSQRSCTMRLVHAFLKGPILTQIELKELKRYNESDKIIKMKFFLHCIHYP